MTSRPRSLATSLSAIASLTLLLAACGGGSGGGDGASVSNKADTAVLTTVASDFSSGQLQLVDLSKDTLNATDPVQKTQTISDIATDTQSDDFYLIERGLDRINKFDLDDTDKRVWRYSTVGANAQGSSNPYQLVFVNDSKAYLLRYGKQTAWIVDPTASKEANFKIGELNLSTYTPSNADVPRMSAGTVVDGKLYITLQQLDSGFDPSNTSCVAVFDVSSNEPIQTGTGSACGQGIALKGRNPGSIQFQEGIGLLVQNTGSYDPDYSLSSIDVIDPDTFEVETLVQADKATGLITSIAVLDQKTGFFLGYDSFGSLDLRRFDPSTGDVTPNAFGSLKGEDLRTITIGPEQRLWVANAETGNPRVTLLDPSTGMVIDSVATDLLPTGIDFAQSED